MTIAVSLRTDACPDAGQPVAELAGSPWTIPVKQMIVYADMGKRTRPDLPGPVRDASGTRPGVPVMLSRDLRAGRGAG